MEYTYLLAIMWCTQWQIHGVWVDYTNGSYPQNCSNMPFNLDILKANNTLYNQMTTYWHGCYGNDVDFWQHEWAKHGTCTGWSLVDYFVNTVGYFLQYSPSFDNRCDKSDQTCTIPLQI